MRRIKSSRKSAFSLIGIVVVCAIIIAVTCTILAVTNGSVHDSKVKNDSVKAATYTSSMQRYASEVMGTNAQYPSLSAKDYMLVQSKTGKGAYPGYGLKLPSKGNASVVYKSIRKEAAISSAAYGGAHVDSDYYVASPEDTSSAFVYYYLDGTVKLKKVSDMKPITDVTVASNKDAVKSSDYWVFLSNPGGRATVIGSGTGTGEVEHDLYIKVVDYKNSTSLEDTNVMLSGGTGLSTGYSGMTVNNGYYVIRGAKLGVYNISAIHAGYWDFPSNAIYANDIKRVGVGSSDYVGDSVLNPFIIKMHRGTNDNAAVGLYTKFKTWDNTSRSYILSKDIAIKGTNSDNVPYRGAGKRDYDASVTFGQKNTTIDATAKAIGRTEVYEHNKSQNLADQVSLFTGKFIMHDNKHALNIGSYNMGVAVSDFKGVTLDTTVQQASVVSPGIINKSVIIGEKSYNELPVLMRKRLTTLTGIVKEESSSQPNYDRPNITGVEAPNSKLQDIRTYVTITRKTDGKQYKADVGKDGYYRITDIEDGDYTYKLWNQYQPKGYYKEFPQDFIADGYDTDISGVTPHDDKTVCNPKVSLKYNDVTQDPIPGAFVTLERLNQPNTDEKLITDVNGSVQYHAKDAGFYNVYVQVPWELDVTYTYKLLIIDSNEYILYYDYGYYSNTPDHIPPTPDDGESSSPSDSSGESSNPESNSSGKTPSSKIPQTYHNYRTILGTGYVVSKYTIAKGINTGIRDTETYSKDANYDNYGLNLVASTLYNSNNSALSAYTGVTDGCKDSMPKRGTGNVYKSNYAITKYGTSGVMGSLGSWGYYKVRPGIYDVTWGSKCTYDSIRRVLVRKSDTIVNLHEVLFCSKPEAEHPEFEKVQQDSSKLRQFFRLKTPNLKLLNERVYDYTDSLGLKHSKGKDDDSAYKQHRVICKICGKPFELETHNPDIASATCTEPKMCLWGYNNALSSPSALANYRNKLNLTLQGKEYWSQCGEILQLPIGHELGHLTWENTEFGEHMIDCVRYTNIINGVDWGCHHRMWPTGSNVSRHQYSTYTYSGPNAYLSNLMNRMYGHTSYSADYTNSDTEGKYCNSEYQHSKHCTFQESITGRNEKCKYVDIKPHNFYGWEYTTDSRAGSYASADGTLRGKHWRRCRDCGYLTDIGNHVPNNCDYCTEDQRCEVCGCILRVSPYTTHEERYVPIDDYRHRVFCTHGAFSANGGTHPCAYESEEYHEDASWRDAGSCHVKHCYKCNYDYEKEPHDWANYAIHCNNMKEHYIPCPVCGAMRYETCKLIPPYHVICDDGSVVAVPRSYNNDGTHSWTCRGSNSYDEFSDISCGNVYTEDCDTAGVAITSTTSGYENFGFQPGLVYHRCRMCWQDASCGDDHVYIGFAGCNSYW